MGLSALPGHDRLPVAPLRAETRSRLQKMLYWPGIAVRGVGIFQDCGCHRHRPEERTKGAIA